jgi:hypothetical protein
VATVASSDASDAGARDDMQSHEPLSHRLSKDEALANITEHEHGLPTSPDILVDIGGAVVLNGNTDILPHRRIDQQRGLAMSPCSYHAWLS